MKGLQFSWKYALAISVFVILIMLIIDFNSRVANLRKLAVQHERVSAELASLEQQHASLETQIAYANSEDAVVDWAYEEGNLVRPGDHPIVPFPPSDATPVPTPTRSIQPITVEKWQVWLWLFTDTSPGERQNFP